MLITSRPILVTLGVVITLAVSGCVGQPPRVQSRTTVTVFAAASLTEVFTALGKQFEQEHPEASIVFSFGSSSALAKQITEKAPADVFASASMSNMNDVRAQIPESVVFAENVLQIAVPKGNRAHVSNLNDLARPGVKVAVCQPQVPCGVVAKNVTDKAHLNFRPVSFEADVKGVVNKVKLGEVDAGLVYATDVKAAKGQVKGVNIPDNMNASTSYVTGVLASTSERPLATAWQQFILSSTGQKALIEAGFKTSGK